MPVSAVDCVQPALQHAREQLFTRFRFGQWSRLALVGILAAELRSGGCNFNPGHFAGPSQNNGNRFPFPAMPHGLPSFNHGHISPHLGQILGLIAVAIFAVFVLMFVFLYINSVFRFILFDSVLRRECSISEGWRKYHRAGLRFFLWQLVLMISTGMFLALLVGLPLAIAFASGWMTDIREHIGRMIVGVILLVGLFVVFGLTVAVVQALARDFLVPIMALEDLDFADGWHRLLGMIQPEKGRFAVYLLLKLVLSIAAAIVFGIIAIIPASVRLGPCCSCGDCRSRSGLGLERDHHQSGDHLRNLAAAPDDLFDRTRVRSGHRFLPGLRAVFSCRSISESERAALSRASGSGIAARFGVSEAV